MATEDYDGVEIPQELLDVIAGGTVSERTKDQVRAMCAKYKANGNDLGQVQVLFRRMIPDEATYTYGELCNYIETIWPEV